MKVGITPFNSFTNYTYLVETNNRHAKKKGGKKRRKIKHRTRTEFQVGSEEHKRQKWGAWVFAILRNNHLISYHSGRPAGLVAEAVPSVHVGRRQRPDLQVVDQVHLQGHPFLGTNSYREAYRVPHTYRVAVQLGGEAVDRDDGRSCQSMSGEMKLSPDCAVVAGM